MPSQSYSVTDTAASAPCLILPFLCRGVAVPTASPLETLLETEHSLSWSHARRAERCSFTTGVQLERLLPQPRLTLVAGDPLLSRALRPTREMQSSQLIPMPVPSRSTFQNSPERICSRLNDD